MEQGSKEWLQVRRRHIGASDAPVIMGVSPFKTVYELWMEKLGTGRTSVNAAMQRGLDMEGQAREHFSMMTGIEVKPSASFSRSVEFMMASLDGISSDGLTIVEIKCAGQADHGLAVKGQVPEHYMPQLQHQMAVCEVKELYYFSYDGLTEVYFEGPKR